MLVVITFLSLPVCHDQRRFHQVEFVQARLSPRGRAISRCDLRPAVARVLRACCCGSSCGSSSPPGGSATSRRPILETPLWMPRLAMVIGMAALCFSLLRTLAADLGRLRAAGSRAGRAMGPELQLSDRHRPVSRPAHGRDGGAVRDRGAGGHLPAAAGRACRRSTASAW